MKELSAADELRAGHKKVDRCASQEAGRSSVHQKSHLSGETENRVMIKTDTGMITDAVEHHSN